MKRLLAFALFFAAVSAFAHAGHVHTYMGTVTTVQNNNEFLLTTAEGRDFNIVTTSSTVFTDANDHAAKFSDLVRGVRVVVKMNVDGKTADSVKIGAAK